MAEPIIFQLTPTTGSASGSLETGITLKNGCFARQFGFSSWNKIRLGMRIRFVPTGSIATVVASPFTVGFCNGIENIPGTSFINNFVGFTTYNFTSTPTLVRHSSNDAWYYQQSYWATAASGSTFKHLGRIDGLAAYSKFCVSAQTASCVSFFVDVERGPTPTTFTGSVYTWYVQDYAVLATYPTLITFMSLANFQYDVLTSVPSRTRYLYNSFRTGSMTNEATDGELNSVCVWWGREDPVLQILDLYVVRLA